MVVIAKGNKPERLQTGALEFAHRLQHFRHAMDRARTRVERDLHEITGREFLRHLKQAAVDRDGLKLRSRLLPAFRMYRGSYGTVQLNARRTFSGIDVGEVSHSRNSLHPVRRRTKPGCGTIPCSAVSGQITKALVRGPGAALSTILVLSAQV